VAFFFYSRRRHTRFSRDWSSDVCSSDLFRYHYRRTRREVFPVLSRIQNIGYELGENGRTPEWYRANHRTPWVAGTLPNGTFTVRSEERRVGKEGGRQEQQKHE